MILKEKLNYSWNRKHKYNVNYAISDSRLNMAEAYVYLCHQCTHWWLRWILWKKRLVVCLPAEWVMLFNPINKPHQRLQRQQATSKERALAGGYDCSIILPRETYAIGNYTSIAVTLLMNKYRIRFASCSNSTSKFSLVNVYKTHHQHISIEYVTCGTPTVKNNMSSVI